MQEETTGSQTQDATPAVEANPTQENKPSNQERSAHAANSFWARFPNQEDRSRIMKERWAKAREKRALSTAGKATLKGKPRRQESVQDTDYDQALAAWHGMRRLLADMLTLLEGLNPTCAYILHGDKGAGLRRQLAAAKTLIEEGLSAFTVSSK